MAKQEKKDTNAAKNAPASATKRVEASGKQTATVIEKFRDRNDYNTVYEVGEDVSHLPKDVLQSLLNRGHIELSGELESVEDPTIGYKQQVDDLIKDAPDELKKKVLDVFGEIKFDGPNHFKSFLDSARGLLATSGDSNPNSTPQA